MVKPDGTAEVGAPIQIYLAEEDDTLRQTCASALRARGYDVIDCSDGVSLFSRLEERLSRAGARRSVVVAQGRLPVLSALQILHSLRRLDIELPFVLMTRAHERSVRDTAERAGASAILLKPFPVDELVTLVRTLVDARSVGASSDTAKAPSEEM